MDMGIEKGGAENPVFTVDDLRGFSGGDAFGDFLNDPIDDQNIG